MIINGMVLLYNSVDMPVSGPYAGKWQVCSDCAPCTACTSCFCGNSECPVCFDGITKVSEKYIFWTFTARPGWPCEYESRPDCKTGHPISKCSRLAVINQNTGEEECCIKEVWEDYNLCGGVAPPGPDGPRTRKTKRIGPTPNGIARKEESAPRGPHPCQCKPNSRCAWYDPVNYTEEPWRYKMPCSGMCDEDCTGCDPFWLSCSYCWTGAYPSGNCNTDCTCKNPAPVLEETNMVVSASHVVAKSTKYAVGQWDPSGGSDQKWCEPREIEWYPNDNGPDVRIGTVRGQPCADAHPNSGGIGSLQEAGQADENGEFIWRNMRFEGFDPRGDNCPGTMFYTITASVKCGRAYGTEGCREGCVNGMGIPGEDCGASGTFLYYARYDDEEGATFTQIGKETYSAAGPCSTVGLSFADRDRVLDATSRGGGIIHLSGGEILPSAPTFRGPSACSLNPTQIKFSCPLGVQ